MQTNEKTNKKMNKITPLKAIRKHCLECQGGSCKSVRQCENTECRFWIYRMGHNPARKGIGGCPNMSKKEENGNQRVEEKRNGDKKTYIVGHESRRMGKNLNLNRQFLEEIESLNLILKSNSVRLIQRDNKVIIEIEKENEEK